MIKFKRKNNGIKTRHYKYSFCLPFNLTIYIYKNKADIVIPDIKQIFNLL